MTQKDFKVLENWILYKDNEIQNQILYAVNVKLRWSIKSCRKSTQNMQNVKIIAYQWIHAITYMREKYDKTIDNIWWIRIFDGLEYYMSVLSSRLSKYIDIAKIFKFIDDRLPNRVIVS